MVPLFAHLARALVPASIMKNKAPNVFRWTERMNRAGIYDCEFPDCPEAFYRNDEISTTLETVLRLIVEDWTREIIANVECYNAWINANPDLPAGHLVSESHELKVHPSLGQIKYRSGESHIERESAPHSLWHLDKALSQARSLASSEETRLNELLRRLGGDTMMAIKLARPMKRENYALVLV